MNATLTTRADGAPPVGDPVEIAIVWSSAALAGLLGAWTCFAALPGLNWPLWTLAATAGLIVSRRRSHDWEAHALCALLAACLLSGSAAITADAHSTTLIFLAVAALCGFALLATTRPVDGIGPGALAGAPLALGRRLIAEVASRFAELLALARMRDAIPLVRGAAMAALIAVALFLLLSAADPTLGGWRDIAWSAALSWTFVARDLFFIVLSTFLLGAYGLAARLEMADARTAGIERDSLPDAAPLHRHARARFTDLERLMVLGAALALFALFFAVELLRWLGVAGLPLSGGDTLAEATHRGFGEMIAAGALCALVIIGLDERALRGPRERLVRIAGWTVIAASVIVVASAFARVRYYEAAYGWTEPRLYVEICCAGMAAALALLGWELGGRLDLPRLTRRIALTGIVCIAVPALWNSSAWIVRANVERYERTGRFDAAYLARLARHSPDAVPQLLASLPTLAPADAGRLRDALRHLPQLRPRVPRPDGSRVSKPGARAQSAAARPLSWYEWNLRRAAARAALRAAGLLDTPPPR